jgi:hypothetical protein
VDLPDNGRKQDFLWGYHTGPSFTASSCCPVLFFPPSLYSQVLEVAKWEP